MPSQTDYPISIGSRDDWALGAGASKIAAVATNDGDSSILICRSGGAQKVQLFRFAPLVGVTDPVTSSTLYTWARQSYPGVGARYFYLYWNGVQAGTNWGEFYNSFPGYISDGIYASVSLTLAAVNGEHGFIGYGSGGPDYKWDLWLTQFYRVTVFTYSVGGGGSGSADSFQHLVGSIAAAIGANLLMRDMPALARSIQAKTRTLILPEEYAEALAAWKAHRHLHLVGA